jgi:hypothetical protein
MGVGPVEDPDFAKQNDRDSAARPLAYLPTKPLKQGFDVPPRQAAVYRSGEDQLKGALVLPLHSSIVLPLGTRWGIHSIYLPKLSSHGYLRYHHPLHD